MIGRAEEIRILKRIFEAEGPEMVAITGRRRVGKTYLIREVLKNQIDFEIVGIHKGTRQEQLINFCHSLKNAGNFEELPQKPVNWMKAFAQLIDWLEPISLQKRTVLFFDELPWIATRNGDFLKAFGHFWNSWASRKNILVIICGSAASWMIRKVINNKGGLHNRVTRQITLNPFTLSETESYLQKRGIEIDRYQIILLYMALGGLPYYLNHIEPGLSAAQNIDKICFSKSAPLRNEFGNLYRALYDHADRHITIIRALASKWKGLSLNEIIEQTGLASGGTLTETIEELELSGFINAFAPFGKKKKDTVYRLMDEFSQFYLQFMEQNTKTDPLSWQIISQLQEWKSWSGFAFESICLKHVQKIKEALQIAGVHSKIFSFRAPASDVAGGVQIDLLIDRNDQTMNICEIKFYHAPFSLTANYAQDLRLKREALKIHSGTKKQLFITLISTHGLVKNSHSIGLIDNDLSIDNLF
jgi:predicted AAA+ superfamily ATPase